MITDAKATYVKPSLLDVAAHQSFADLKKWSNGQDGGWVMRELIKMSLDDQY